MKLVSIFIPFSAFMHSTNRKTIFDRSILFIYLFNHNIEYSKLKLYIKEMDVSRVWGW